MEGTNTASWEQAFVQNNWYIYIGLVYDQHINIFGGPVPGISEIMFAEYTTETAPVSNVRAVGSTRGWVIQMCSSVEIKAVWEKVAQDSGTQDGHLWY